jgi:hypothetical protein
MRLAMSASKRANAYIIATQLSLMPKSGRQRLPKAVAGAKNSVWDDSPLWDRESAKVDFNSLYVINRYEEESNSFHMQSRPFPGVGLWQDLGRFPGHYYNHIFLLNFMHAWCRDVLELGRWNVLDGLTGETQGVDIRDMATRTMRYLSRVRERFLLEVAEYRKESSPLAFPEVFRIPPFDLHLLALYNNFSFSSIESEKFLAKKSTRAALSEDAIGLGEQVPSLL